jgi:hypothetical protein
MGSTVFFQFLVNAKSLSLAHLTVCIIEYRDLKVVSNCTVVVLLMA